MAILTLVVIFAGLPAEAADAGEGQNVSAVYSDGVLSVFGYAPSGYEKEYVTLSLSGDDGISHTGYSYIGSDRFFRCMIECSDLVDGRYVLECAYNKIGATEKTLITQFKINSSVALTAYLNDTVLQISGVVPDSLSGCVMDISILDSNYNFVATGYSTVAGTEVSLSVDVDSSVNDDCVVMASFNKLNDCPTTVLCDVELQSEVAGGGFDGYTILIGDSTNEGSSYVVDMTSSSSDGSELSHYSLYFELGDNDTTSVTGIVSDEQSVTVLIPNKISLLGKEYSVVIIGNGSGSIVNCDVQTIVLERVTTIKTISSRSFYDASSIKEFIFGEGLKNINSFSFRGTSLESIRLPSSLEFVGTGAFQNCTQLETVDVVEGDSYELKEMEYNPFSGCESIKSVTLPFGNDFIPSIDRSACNLFEDSKKLVSITSVNGSGRFIVGGSETISGLRENWIYESLTDGTYKILTTTSVPEMYEMEDIISAIAPRAFVNAKDLRHIVMSDNLTSIGTSAFDHIGLESVVFGSSLQVIAGNAFAGNNLSEVRFPATLTYVSTDAFANNVGLTRVTFEGGTVDIENPFNGCPINTMVCEDASGCIYTNWGIITGSGDIVELTISGPFDLSERSFNSNTLLKKVTFTGNIISIDQRAFTGCSSIESYEYTGASSRFVSEDGVLIDNGSIILVPQKVSLIDLSTPIISIGDMAFRGNTSLVQVSFSDDSTLALIPSNAFRGCKALVSITIPTTVTAIGDGAFQECSSLSEVLLGEDSKLSTIGDDAFRGTAIVTIALPETISSIGERCFMDCMNLIDINIVGDNLETIKSQTWSGSYIRNIVLPRSVVSIDSTAFENCINLTEITFGNGSPYLFDGNAVYKGNELIIVMPTTISYSLPSTITQIQEGAFDGARDLQEIIADDNTIFNTYSGILFNKDLTEIIFVPMGIRNVSLPSSITSIGSNDISFVSPFVNCNSIQTFTWSGQSLSLVETRISADTVILDASSSVDLGVRSFMDVNNLILSSPRACLNYPTSYKIENFVLTVSELSASGMEVLNLCIDTNDQGVFEENLSKVGGLSVERIYVSGESLIVDSPKYSGLFDYDKNDGTCRLPYIYASGVSVFAESFVDACSVSDMILESGILSFNVSIRQGYYGDISVYVGENELEYDSSSGKYTYALDNGVKQIHIIINLIKSDKTHNVTLHFNNGASSETIQIPSGGAMINSYHIVPTKSGYTFMGWYTDSSLTQPFDVSSKVKADMDLFAGWEYNDGKYLIKVLNHETDVLLKSGVDLIRSEEMIEGGTTVLLQYNNTVNWECLGWIINNEAVSSLSPVLLMDKDYYIEPVVRYTSPSNDLMDVVNIKTPKYGEDVYLQYSLSYGGIDSSMGVWSGFPSTPALMDDAVFIRAGATLYKYDSNTGEILATAESSLLVNYYLYLGVGGGKVFDYATGKVYDSDLNYLYTSQISFTSVFYDSGFFYGQYGGKVYKMAASDGSLITAGSWGEGVTCNWFGLYGTTSTPLFIDGHMYVIEAEAISGYRGLREINLENGTSTVISLDHLNGRLLDDGWLTYTVYSGKTIIFLPSYSRGLFEIGDNYERASLTAIVINDDGTLSNKCPIVCIENNDFNLTAAFLIFNGRGYMNTGPHLYVVDADKLSREIIQRNSGLSTISADVFESEYVIYTEQSVGSHGSIVLSTGYFEETGRVYVYILPYNPPSSVYIFEDYDGKTQPTGYYKSSVIGSNYCSQAVRVTLKGNLIWYTDSGIVYCCGTIEKNPYHFSIDCNGSLIEVDGYGATALDALRHALRNNGISNDISTSGRILSLNNQIGTWVIESYYDSRWNVVSSLSNAVNNTHHTYRISYDSGTLIGKEVDFSISSDAVTLMIDSEDDNVTLSVVGELPLGVTFIWEPVDEDILVIDVLNNGVAATIRGLNAGTTVINVILSGDGVYGEAQCAITVIENPDPPERSYIFTLRMEYDADKADYGNSGLMEYDMRAGITLSATGSNAGSALEAALKANGIPCQFWTSDDGSIRYWVDNILGLGDVKLDGGLWKYWIQYQIIDGKVSYNELSLGYYTHGGEFCLIYGVTEESGQVVLPTDPEQHTHSWDAGTVTKEPTCTEVGEKTYTCSCGETKTEALPSLGHDWSDWILITDATTEHDGLKERTCSRCGEKESVTIPKIVVTDNADGSQTKTEELIDGTEVTTTTGTETVVTAVSEDGSVSTSASSDTGSKELVTEVKADETDGSCTVSNDTVQTAIRQQEIVSDAIGDDGKEKVLTITSATENVSASLEKGSLSDLAENDVNLRVASTQGSMTFGKDVLTSLSEKDDVTLSFSVAERSDLTESQKETIEIGSTVVSLTAMSNGQSVGRELGGKVTVVVKHTAAEGKDAVAYYVDGEGNRTKVAEQYYDAEKGEMTMVLDHFSIYVIMDEEPEQAVPYILYGLLAFIVVVCLGIMFPQVFGRKQ